MSCIVPVRPVYDLVAMFDYEDFSYLVGALWIGHCAKPGSSVTELIYYFFYYSTLKLRGSCLYWYAHVGFGSQ